jgi:hypothetical protein
VLLNRYKQKDRLFLRLYGIQPDHIIHNPDKYLSRFVRGDVRLCNTLQDLLEITSKSTNLTNQKFDNELRTISITICLQLYLLALGVLLLFANKNYRINLAPFTLTVLSCLFFTYSIGSTNPRFYSLFIPLQLLIMALPLDAILHSLLKKFPLTHFIHIKP